MGNEEFLDKSKKLVKIYMYEADYPGESLDTDIYVVWSCKTLQNNKALLSTDVSDGMYYEVTYNGDKKEFYFDAYKKALNKGIDSDSLEDSYDKYFS